MPKLFQLELVTAEAKVVSDSVQFIRAPGLDGEFGILANHVATLTPLRPGEVKVVYSDHEDHFFVGGGFIEVLPDRVVILADAAERADDIDQARAEAARQRAKEALASNSSDAAAAAALERAMSRIRVSEVRRRHREPRKAPPVS